MAYKFGAAAGDDMTFTGGGSITLSGNSLLMAGWYYPTSLNSSDTLWSNGTSTTSSTAAYISGTTTNIDVMLNMTTTVGTWASTGTILTINTWYFIAVLLTGTNAGPVYNCRVWIGTQDTRPVLQTITNNFVPAGTNSSSTSYTIGNRAATGTTAFKGDIAYFTRLFVPHGINSLIPVQTRELFTTAEEVITYERVIEPLWNGTFQRSIPSTTTTTIEMFYASMDNDIVARYSANTASSPGAPYISATINGATKTLNDPPFRPEPNWFTTPKLRRRR